MKKQDSQCKQHVTLIQQLLNENQLLKQKYDNLLRAHQKLTHSYNKLNQGSLKTVKSLDVGTVTRDQISLTSAHEEQQISIPVNHRFSRNVDEEIGEINFQEHFKSSPEVKTAKIEAKGSKDNDFEKTSVEIKPALKRASHSSSRSSSFADKFFPLIQGCFIIEKKKCYSEKSKNSLSQMLEFIYPEQLAKTERQTIQMMLKYTLVNPEITKFQDDQFCSRKNEIIFGTPYEDYMYAFEDGKWVGKRELPEIMKLMGTMKKKYCHILVRPEIVQREEVQADDNKQKKQGEQMLQQGQWFYQTQVIYGFLSPFPLRVFFQDLHRTIQQQLKYNQFSIDEHQQQVYNPTPNRKNKYKIMGSIMQKLYQYEYKINKFPLEIAYACGVTKIELKVPTVIAYREMQDEFLVGMFGRYDGGKVCKLLHYVLAEKCVLVEVGDRRALNQLLEMVRIMIRPFLWIFATVYVYSDYFEPFMSSPMPIIIGKVTEPPVSNSSIQQKQPSRRTSTDYSEFCHIVMDSQPLQQKQSQLYFKVIKKLKKQWDKCDNDRARVALIHSYVHSLRIFIEKGVLNSEPTDFHIEFIDTQMVSYFKDTKDQL